MSVKTQNAVSISRAQNFADWYQEVVRVADLAEHAEVRGCMVIKPWGYALWENIQTALDRMIKETGHQNVYFPLLIPLSFLEKEAAHVEGFAKECAVVTHYRLEADGHGKLVPAPDAKLTEPYIIRPTSETIIGNAMAKWVHSYNDLPVLINQWCNIVRWEMRTRLFLRTSEFLWQEGHTAHATEAEAREEALKMLDVYETLAKDYLAIPVIKGEKTASERFPGAVDTYCIEAMMQDGKALQAGTSHFLGQNFSKANEIQFTDEHQQQQYTWTTSWGVSTRLIGGLIMTHSDDDGLVLPPRVAPVHVVLIPIAKTPEDMATVEAYCQQLAVDLKQQRYHDMSVQVLVDRSKKNGGEKFWGAVKKGIPVRIEIGKRELESNALTLTRRDKPAKEKITISRESLLSTITLILDEIQSTLYQRAVQFRNARIKPVDSLKALEVMFSQEEQQENHFALAYCDPEIESDEKIQEKLKSMKLTARCIPYEMQEGQGACIFSGKTVSTKIIFARAY